MRNPRQPFARKAGGPPLHGKRRARAEHDGAHEHASTRGDRERGYIETHDRYGELRRFPIMTVSVAALTTDGRETRSFTELARRAAEAKQQAKAIAGSSYVRDGVVIVPARPMAVA